MKEKEIQKASNNFKSILDAKKIEYLEKNNVFFFPNEGENFPTLFKESFNDSEELQFKINILFFTNRLDIFCKMYNSFRKVNYNEVFGHNPTKNIDRITIPEILDKMKSTKNPVVYSAIDLENEEYSAKLVKLLYSYNIINEKTWSDRIEESKEDKSLTR